MRNGLEVSFFFEAHPGFASLPRIFHLALSLFFLFLDAYMRSSGTVVPVVSLAVLCVDGLKTRTFET